jgi:hypothetical protein
MNGEASHAAAGIDHSEGLRWGNPWQNVLETPGDSPIISPHTAPVSAMDKEMIRLLGSWALCYSSGEF